MPTSARSRGIVSLFAMIGLMGGCQKEPTASKPTAPTVVTVSQPLQQTVTECVEATGTLAALESVDIRARVTGWLQSIHFKPRTLVKKDDLLFVIDPRPFKAKLDQAEAEVTRRNAERDLADFEFKRMKELKQRDAAADVEIARNLARFEQSKGALAAAVAAVEQAKLDLDYTQVRSPIGGTVSRNLVDTGNLVGSGESTLLTTVVNEESLYAYFDISESDLLALLRMRGTTRSTSSTSQKIDAQAFLALTDETGFPHEGRIDFVETRIDPATGTIRCRGIFTNPTGVLLPGMFVRVRVPVGKPKPSLMVTERAMGVDQGQYYLLIVNDKNAVEYRPVKVGLLEEGLRAIAEGIAPNDWVIVNGLQRVRDGVTVSPQRAPMPKLSSAETRPAASSATSKP